MDIITEQMMQFIKTSSKDKRIGKGHFTMYLAFLYCWQEQQCNPFYISREYVMELARIGSTSTYHRHMRDMAFLGYVEYKPSYHPGIRTTLFLKALENPINV